MYCWHVWHYWQCVVAKIEICRVSGEGGGGYQGKPTRPTQASLQLLGTCWDPRAKFHFFDYDLNRNWGGMDTISLTTPGHVQLWNVTSDKKKWIRNILRTNIIHPMFAKAKSKKVSQQNTTASFLSSCNYHPGSGADCLDCSNKRHTWLVD